MLLEHGAPTATDRRQVNEGIEQIQWVAALKPATVGVGAYRDQTREYLEIAVLHVALRSGARPARLIELFHRAIPYPVVALVELGNSLKLSVAHKRWSLGEIGKTVLDGEPVTVEAPRGQDPYRSAFTVALSLGRQSGVSLLALYQGWLDTLLALEAARLSGTFTVLPGDDARLARREALQDVGRLDSEVSRLRTAAAREKQIARQVALNLELKRVESERADALARL